MSQPEGEKMERFDPQIAGATDEGFLPMDRTVDGAWVRFSDYEAALDKVRAHVQRERLRAVQAEARIKELEDSLIWALTWIIGEGRMPADVRGLPSDQEEFDKADKLVIWKGWK